MKEIGEKLQQARMSMDITIDEAAEDLKLTPSQLQNIESGDREALREVFNLKQFIRDYAKYLGLEYEKIEDEYGEFVFEYTSKIPLAEIAKASQDKQREQEQTKKIVSPYTIEQKRGSKIIKIIIVILFFLILVISYFIFTDIIGLSI